jgi:ribonuclease BN (tRNA processing enzyme)
MKKITVKPLGTVSPYCKGKHNCPAFLINYNDKKILLDCGNGITRLLNLPKEIIGLNVFITHLHKDHFGDLGLLQYASYVYHNLGLLKDKINIYLPSLDYQDNKKAIINTTESFANYNVIDEQTKYMIDDLVISFYDNKSHTIPSYVIKLENADFKIVYTGDVGNTNIDALGHFCKNADLLICESSLVKSHNALTSTHLHAYEAGMIAKKANVKQLLLTHFWPETPKSEYLAEAKQVFENVAVAEEGKKIIVKKHFE